ncbi:MAG: S8 family serine peptidase [Firmicutes bacterium]|nr:S8 family serine peptidase [Bacillota bacterium]
MKRRGIAVLVLSICVVAIAAFGLWSASDQTLNADNGSTTKWVTGSTPESEARAAEEAQGSDDIVTMLMDQQKKNEDIAKKTNKKDTSKKSNDKKDNIIEETKEDQKDPEKPFDQEHAELMDQVEYSAETLMLKFKKPFDGKVNSELERAGVAKLDVLFEMEDHIWYTAYLKKTADVDKTLENVREFKKVAVAEYNFKYETTAAESFDAAVGPNPGSGEQHHHKMCGIKDAWKKVEKDKGCGGGSSNVVVAVIDTGVDYNHEDLKANMWYNSKEIPNNNIDDDGNGYVDDYYGVDMTADDGLADWEKFNGSGMDDNGHGTHVAGIIAASNNKTGVVGIAYNTKIMAIKAGDASGYFMQSNIAEAILYAYDNGADVINMSFGGSASSIAVQDALATAYSRCTLVASAGNDGKPNESTDYYKFQPDYMPSYPAALSYVLGVMSVDQNNVEASFTNWDAKLYNSYEYEVYAPGGQIYSTIPGDRYAKMSGTSMAAPVVSAQAAILRSYYEDTNTYPTKFIYGQIVGTAEDKVQCINPAKHTVNGMPHNIPGVVNFYDSITELPTPDIGMSDYTLFDAEEFVADTKGITKGKVDKNNGDGIIDAGETIALGFTLKNRWGMSKDTVVSIDATNEAGVKNPYVTFLNNDINYKSIGTYSESDSGKLYSEDGEMWNGWEKPFYIKIADNCPNDYSVTLNVTITYKNGLNESDTTVYEDEATILLTVRRGVELPNIIDKDTTLTKENYYIIPNAMTVMEGATLRIEEGTQIQFWCSDPQDSYADTAIAYLKVNGKLICEGTEEEPIKMFPSGWMDRYVVRIYTAGDGYASMKYTNVVNPYLYIDYAENCEFTQNYKEYLMFRSLSNGTVETQWLHGAAEIKNAKECAFYKLGGSDKYAHYEVNGNTYERCIFVDCMIRYHQMSMVDCVFYGNNNYWDNKQAGGTSTFNINKIEDQLEIEKVFTNKETGTNYITIRNSTNTSKEDGSKWSSHIKDIDKSYIKSYARFAEKLGGNIVALNSLEEYNFIYNNLDLGSDVYQCGIIKDVNSGKILNYDGSEIVAEIPVIDDGIEKYGYIDNGGIHFNAKEYRHFEKYILEIPGEVYISDIQLEDYVVNMDTTEKYQIEATVTPTTADVTELIYESQDEAVVVVDENGLVTPVGQGCTDIRVYAPDRAVYNYVTINVAEEVIPTDIKAKKEEITLAVGGTKRVGVDFTPADATKKALTYKSSDTKVATVNDRGVIKAESVGEATITITGYEGITTAVKVNCVVPAESITFEEAVYVTTLTKEDGTDFYPVISPVDSTQSEIKWTSSNPEVCYVDENGKLVKLKEGTAGLKAELVGTEFSAIVTVAISENRTPTNVIKMASYDSNRFALLESGNLWVWGNRYKNPEQIPVEKVKDFMVFGGQLYILDSSGNVNSYYAPYKEWGYDYANAYKDTESVIENVISLTSNERINDSFYAITEEGAVWAWGQNGLGQLGDGTKTYASFDSPVQVDINVPVKKVINAVGTTLLLTENGHLYATGHNSVSAKKIYESVKDVYHDNYDTWRVYIDFGNKCINWYADTWQELDIITKAHETEKRSYHYTYINNGKVYIKEYNYGGYSFGNEYAELEKIVDAQQVYDFGKNVYVQTTDGRFYAVGSGNNWGLGNGSEKDTSVPVRVYFGLTDNVDGLVLQGWNAATDDSGRNIIAENSIVLDYNQMLEKGTYYGQIKLQDSKEKSLTLSKTLELDKLTIVPTTKMVVGETYTLTIPEGALAERVGSVNEATTLTFIYKGEGSIETDESNGSESGEEGDSSNDDEVIEDAKVTHDTVIDKDKLATRDKWTEATITDEWEKFVEGGHNTRFYSNVILNRLNDDDTSTWLRITAPESGEYQTIGLGGNYWGTTNKKLVDKQILDYDDFGSLADINEGEILTEAPSNTYPFVVDAYLELKGEKTDTVGNDLVTFVVDFNRAMDTSIDLSVQFGSAYPYADYTVEGEWATDKQWRGTMQLTTIIENGYQYWSVSNGKAAGTSLKLYKDWGRFPFMIDTSAAQSLLMDGEATETGIKLTWEQDDFETLAGYNVYRSEEEDGQYKKLNTTVIPADTKEWFDDTVMPGQKYYYNFTVVQTDLTESEPSGKVIITAMDTMSPGIYHDPVFHAFTGSNLVISAVVHDNVKVDNATLYYRTKGETEWKSKEMTNNNDKYSAVISASEVTVDGIEYYIEATDGISTTRKGTAKTPIEVAVQVAVSANDKGDVDSNGAVELKDAMMVLMAINDRYNMTEEEFARADLDDSGVLEAKEALRILQYVNGSIGSIL